MNQEHPSLDVQAELASEITAIRLSDAQESADRAEERVAIVRHMLVCGIAADLARNGNDDGTLATRARHMFDQTLLAAGSDKLSAERPSDLHPTDLRELPLETPGLVERGKTRTLQPAEFIAGILENNRELLDEITQG